MVDIKIEDLEVKKDGCFYYLKHPEHFCRFSGWNEGNLKGNHTILEASWEKYKFSDLTYVSTYKQYLSTLVIKSAILDIRQFTMLEMLQVILEEPLV